MSRSQSPHESEEVPVMGMEQRQGRKVDTVKDIQSEKKPAIVTEKPKQAGETLSHWHWVERSVWTESMLAALETGVKGGKWFSLIDKVYNPKNLRAAWEKVRQNRGSKGVDGQTIHEFELHCERNLLRLSKELERGTYTPGLIKRVNIEKPGTKEKRPLGVPSVSDRVVQTALRNAIEPIFEKKFVQHNYGFRPGLGCKDALRQVQTLLNCGYTYIVDADISKYFDTIPHDRLMKMVQEEIADGRVLKLIEVYLKAGILEENLSVVEPECGTPQGGLCKALHNPSYAKWKTMQSK